MNHLHYKSETHKSEIIYRIIYTVILYIVMLIGIFHSFKNINKIFISTLLLLAIYPIFVLGWMGANRYFVPSLIYLSVFFGNGMVSILNIKKFKAKYE